MIQTILADSTHTLTDIAADCGIDWSELCHSLTFDGRKIKHNRIALSKDYRGKCFAVGHKFTARDNKEYPFIVFYTNKHGGLVEKFNGYAEHMAARGYSNQYIQKQLPPKFHEIEKQPIEEVEQWQINALNEAHAAWNNAKTDNVSSHEYALKKGISLDGLDVRRGNGKYGDCLMVQVFNIFGMVQGYQQIYANKIQGKETNKHFIGKMGAGFVCIGDRSKVKKGAWVAEGVFTGLAIYHANGDGTSTLSNAKKQPVLCALSADNMKKVTRAFTEIGTPNLKICADNDPKENGNTGIYTALQCAMIAGVKSYFLPTHIEGNATTDFADTLQFTECERSTSYIEYIQDLMRVVPIANIKKLSDTLAFAIARQLPYLCSEETAVNVVVNALNARGYVGKNNAKFLIEKSVAERREIVRKRNKITDFTGINKINFDDLPDDSKDANQIIAKTLCEIGDDAIIFDSRGLGTGKTELLELLRNHFKLEKIAVITHRVSLSHDLATRIGTDHYQEESTHSNLHHLTICANSLPKFGIAARGFKVLFIDEARQVVDHLICGSVENRQAAFNEFVQAIENADFVICSDADLNDATVAFFRKHANGKTLHAIDAPARANDKILHMVGSHAENIVKISEALNSGDSAFIGCTSKDKAIEAHAFALSNAKGFDADDLLLIHSENKDDPKQAAFLKNPNVEAVNYQGVFHSPTIGSGVSITVEHFTANYLLNSGNLSENQVLQMTARNRRSKDIYISCGEQSTQPLLTNFDLLREGKGKQQQSYVDDPNGFTFTPNELGALRIELSSVNNHALNDYRNNFLLLAQINGYEIRRPDADILETTDAQEKTKGLGKTVKQATCSRIFATQTPDATTAETLSKHKQAERDQLDKLSTIEMAGTHEITPDDVYNFKFDGALTVLLNHENLFSQKSDRVKWDKNNAQTQDRFISKCSLHKVSHAVIVKKLAAETIKNKSRRKLWLELVAKAEPEKAMRSVKNRLSRVRLENRQAAKICQYLKENAGEIAVNGLGNYDKTFKRHVQIVNSFISHFGYETVEFTRGEFAQEFYIKPILDIHRYAMSRVALKQ